MDHIVRALPLVLFSLCSTTGPLYAASLQADGRLRVEGASWKGTRVFVVPTVGAAYEFELSDTRFTIPLTYQDRYMLSFEHEGCPMKQILIDTRVPEQLESEEFGFPFQVTLTYMPENERFEYDGPVGFVRFSAATVDFTYTTQYGMKQHERMDEQLSLLRLAPSDRDELSRKGLSGGMITRILPGDTKTSAPAVEVLSAIADHAIPPVEEVVPRSSLEHLGLRPTVPSHHVPRGVPIQGYRVPEGAPHFPGVGQPRIAATPTQQAPNAAAIVRSVPARAACLGVESPCGSREVIKEPRRVTYISRSSHDGACTELRKVVHAYGAVFFFRNGSSTTEWLYLHALENVGALSVIP
ncbi:MAG: hypothetical protein WAU70_03275 [Flavobacteriales bacterium]